MYIIDVVDINVLIEIISHLAKECVNIMKELTDIQKEVIFESLKFAGRRKVINDYCTYLGKVWTDLSEEEANRLIEILNHMPWI